MIRSHAQPGQNGLLRDPFGPVNGCQADPLAQKSKTFQDLLLTMMTAIEDSAYVLYEGFLAGFTLVTLCTLASVAELDYIPMINFAIVGTLFVPARMSWLGPAG